MNVRFSYIESPTLREHPGQLSGALKNQVMQETSGENKRFQTKDIPWTLTALNDFLHSPLVFSGHEFHEGKRHGDSYKATNVLVVDLDDHMSIKQAQQLLDSIPGSPYYHLSYSSNHDPLGAQKMHVVIPLSIPITNIKQHNLLATWVLDTFKECDHKVRTDVARGIIRSNPTFTNGVLMGGKSPLNIQSIFDVAQSSRISQYIKANQEQKKFAFELTTPIFDSERNEYTVEEIIELLKTDRYTSRPKEYQKIAIFCPVCGFDTQVRSEKNAELLKQNAFIRIGDNKLPYINCQSCASREDGADKKGSYFLASDVQADLAQKMHKFIVFRNKLTDQWWEISFSHYKGETTFYPLAKESSIRHTFWNHAKIDPPDIRTLPQCEMFLDFANPVEMDLKNGFINKYWRNTLMKTADELAKEIQLAPPVPKHIYLLLKHICGDDEEMCERFIDWLAYIYQYRRKTYVAWIFQGTQGIGKDFFYNHIIRAIFGESYCAAIDQERLKSQFNAIIEDNVFLELNEVQTDFSSDNANLIAARIKMLITDERPEVERKNVDIRHGRNNVNVMGFSNKYNGVRVEGGDRRFNICPRQECKLENVSWLPEKGNPKSFEPIIEAELLQFALHLAKRPISETVALKTYMNDAKRRLQHITRPFTEQFFEYVHLGNIDWAWLEERTSDINTASIVQRKLAMPDDSIDKRYITRGELKDLFSDIVLNGNKISMMKFDRILDEHNFRTERLSIGGERKYIVVPSNYTPEKRDQYLSKNLPKNLPKL